MTGTMDPIEPELPEGYMQGYRRAEDDLIEWIAQACDDWRTAKTYTHEELWALAALVAELKLRQARRGTTES